LFGGKVVGASSLAFMTTPPALSPATDYAAGLMLDQLGTHRFIWHNGAVPGGFESALYVFPDDHLVIALLTNTAHGEPGTLDLTARALADLMLAPEPRDLPIDRARRDALVGTYQVGPATLVVRADGDGLAMKAPAGEGRLLYQGGDRFVLAWDHAFEARFAGDTLEIWQLGAKLGTATRAAP
jgi:CubicO group peptidase (beta-lactamase class C family)